MIDSNEIRPGNWIIKALAQQAGERTVYEYKSVAADEYFSTFAKVCFPIKLSSDILGKSGFKHSYGDWYKNLESKGIEGGLPFLRYKHKSTQWYLYDRLLPAQPEYLHQLQNLYYSLTNKELAIQLGLLRQQLKLS